jgi:hypothetical protein
MPCTFCGVGLYGTAEAAESVASCERCPVNSTSVAGSGSIKQCECTRGYRQTLSHDGCIQCNPGYYDNITNIYECSMCAGGLYSTAEGATDVETCQPCSEGTWSEEGSPTCSLCPTNSNSPSRSTLRTHCTCNAGATGPDGETCELCLAGKYKTANGTVACTDCIAGKFSATTGATASSTCVNCSSNSVSSIGSILSTSCLCNSGFTGLDGGSCSACVAGKYKNGIGSAHVPSPPAAGSHCPAREGSAQPPIWGTE